MAKVLSTSGTVFPYTDRPRLMNYMFLFLLCFLEDERRLIVRELVRKQCFYSSPTPHATAHDQS